ncbi:MAG TPA: hypothetical protein PKD24_16295 [Pyrinomonadaceae bacterium]|nr:hypothetical protein [Pyrinomonadaceae bacterium]HMP66927.1 hypothetical protein [Pyrinomonadaceae bacterium]
MENSDALKIIKILVDGIDPTTGEVFEIDSPYQHPQVIRALFSAITAMEQVEERKKRTRSLPPNAGKPWTSNEDTNLHDEFKKGASIGELAKRYGRTRGSIEARLAKLGLIEQGPRFGNTQN